MNIMRKMQENESFMDFYLSEKNNINPKLIASIINAEYITHYSDNDVTIQNDVVNFVKHFKKDNENVFYSIKDLPIFKFYDTILIDKVEKNRKKINEELTIIENVQANKIANQIFSLQKDFMYSVNIDGKSFMNFATSKTQLENELKVLLHNKQGIIIFYFSFKKQKYSFGFSVNNKSFVNILPDTLKTYCNEQDVFFTTLENFLEIKE
jgi:hypothetical protein